MFRPFVRGRPDRGEGYGVGLTIVRRFSERFDWPVRVESQPGKGTRVRVEFPGAECLPVRRQGPGDHGGSRPPVKTTDTA